MAGVNSEEVRMPLAQLRQNRQSPAQMLAQGRLGAVGISRSDSVDDHVMCRQKLRQKRLVPDSERTHPSQMTAHTLPEGPGDAVTAEIAELPVQILVEGIERSDVPFLLSDLL